MTFIARIESSQRLDNDGNNNNFRNENWFTSYQSNFFRISEMFDTFIGQRQFSMKTHRAIRFLYSCYNIIQTTTALVFFLLEFVAFRKALGDTSTLVSQIGLMFTHLVGICKLWILIYRREKIDGIKKKLQDEQYQYEALDDFQPGERMRREKFVALFIATIIFILYTFVGVSAHISAAVMVKKNSIGGTFTGNSSCESFTPYYFYYPFDVSTPNGCYYMLAYMHLCLDVFAWYIASLDMVFVTLLLLLSAQLNIVGEALTTIRKRCLHRLQMKQDFVCLYDKNIPALEQELYKEITHCTKHLHLLIDVRMDIEDIFSFITLVQTVASLLIFASCLFVAAQEPLNSPNFFSQLEYFCAVLSQFSLYCWFGNQMTLAGEAIPSAMYNIDWFSASPRFKQSMLMSMTRMQRPLFVSIGKFTPLALTTLLAVVKGSFSYFTVFQSAGEE